MRNNSLALTKEVPMAALIVFQQLVEVSYNQATTAVVYNSSSDKREYFRARGEQSYRSDRGAVAERHTAGADRGQRGSNSHKQRSSPIALHSARLSTACPWGQPERVENYVPLNGGLVAMQSVVCPCSRCVRRESGPRIGDRSRLSCDPRDMYHIREMSFLIRAW